MQGADPATTPITRLEVIDAVTGAFTDGRCPDRAALLQEAASSGARPDVLSLLEQLPTTALAGPGELWSHFPDVPVGD